ncbi:hypothetical protein [Streptomyces sp. NPDC058108]
MEKINGGSSVASWPAVPDRRRPGLRRAAAELAAVARDLGHAFRPSPP